MGGPDDAFGFGFFPGQFGMAVYSMHPIVLDDVRTFQTFLWADMPGALLPDDPSTPDPADWFSAEEQGAVRLSSKSHWDLPIDIEGRTVHFLVSHPTPPVFDGPEDRNGRRNHDEIRFWADYVTPGKTSAYIYDDAGQRGGLPPGARFVIAGDQNADPLDGDSVPGAAQLLLEHPRVNTSVTPASEGAVEATERQGGANLTHRGDPASTLRTSPTRRQGTCGSTTCSPPDRYASSMPPYSGRPLTTRCSAWWVTSRSRARTTASSGSTSPCPGGPPR